MGGSNQFIVVLWFLPVILFIIIPLCMSCMGLLFFMLDVFRSVACQERKPIKTVSRSGISAAA